MAAEMMFGLGLVTESGGTTNAHYLACRQRQEDFSFQAVLSSLALRNPKGEGAHPWEGATSLGRSSLHACLLCSREQEQL